MVASAETIKEFKSRFDLPEPTTHCLSNAMTVAYYVAFADQELFEKMEFWQVADAGGRGPHIYVAVPIKGEMQVFNKGITWMDDEYPDYSYDSLRQEGFLADRTLIDRFVGFGLEGGRERKRLIDLVTGTGESFIQLEGERG